MINPTTSHFDQATADAHSARWSTLFGQMDKALSEEEGHLVRLLSIFTRGIMHRLHFLHTCIGSVFTSYNFFQAFPTCSHILFRRLSLFIPIRHICCLSHWLCIWPLSNYHNSFCGLMLSAFGESMQHILVHFFVSLAFSEHFKLNTLVEYYQENWLNQVKEMQSHCEVGLNTNGLHHPSEQAVPPRYDNR